MTIAFLVHHRIPTASAAQLVALFTTICLVALPVTLLCTRSWGHVLSALSLGVVLCFLALAVAEERELDTRLECAKMPNDPLGAVYRLACTELAWLPVAAVFGLATCGTIAPVLPLSLVPKLYADSPDSTIGLAYGKFEVVYGALQLVVMLVTGWARQVGAASPSSRPSRCASLGPRCRERASQLTRSRSPGRLEASVSPFGCCSSMPCLACRSPS